MQHRHYPTQHPLHGTVLFNPGDTSVDTSCTKIDDEADLSEPHEVKTIFGVIGQDTQGPAGAPVPEEDEQPKYMELEDEHEVEYRYSDEPEAPEDAIGPVPQLGRIGSFSLDELTKNTEAAAAASVGAKFHGCTSTEMFDALEKAEAEAEANHPSSLSPATSQGNSPRHVDENVSTFSVNDGLRRKVVQKISAALGANPKFLGDAVAAATDCEKDVFESSRSLTVYQSIAANAVRVAREAGGLAEVIRVAKGQPRQQHGELSTPDTIMSIAEASLGELPEVATKVDYYT